MDSQMMWENRLAHFRELADAMAEPEPHDWQFNGPYISCYGITEARAKDLQSRFGGVAKRICAS